MTAIIQPDVIGGGRIEAVLTPGDAIERAGYHCRDSFLARDLPVDIPLGVLAHSTHVRGRGTFDPATGREQCRRAVTPATAIPRDVCERVSLPCAIPPRSTPLLGRGEATRTSSSGPARCCTDWHLPRIHEVLEYPLLGLTVEICSGIPRRLLRGLVCRNTQQLPVTGVRRIVRLCSKEIFYDEKNLTARW